ncbi:MAG: HNH endonuclease, partial [Acidobacteriota bacterium]|nr:HNH endonuclease [Acidobacteriota bacterium]
VERLLAEVRDARRAGRDTPRDASFGLPNLDQRLVLRMSRTDLAKVRSWLDAAAREVVEQTGAEEVSVEQALLYLCEKSRAGARAESDAAAGHVARDQVVYQSCPDCRRARAHTPEGSVEIDGSELERVTASADVEHVVIDGPTPHAMRRKVVARSGGRCANPRCDHRADHCHHIVFRAAGGRTELANEVAVCVTCHALIHAGLLSVTGSAEDGLRWQPMLRPRAAAESANADSPGTAARAAPRPGAPKLDQDALAGGLVRLGHSKTRSVRAIEASIASLPIDQRTEATVLRHALRLA